MCGCVKDTGVHAPGMEVRLCVEGKDYRWICWGQSPSAGTCPLTVLSFSGFYVSGLNFRAGFKMSCNNQLPDCIKYIFFYNIFNL